MTTARLSTGLPELDDHLGGGLLPGTLTVVLGATGIGKTQLGVQFAQAGLEQEGERGIIFDMSSRGDSQSHAEYAERLYDWSLREASVDGRVVEDVWQRDVARADSLHLFRQAGRRVTTSDLDFDQQKEWKAELNRKLHETIRFFYGNFAHGVRRCVIDGIEPTDRPSDSFQFDLFEYISHQILRKEDEWVARDLFRERYRENAEQVAAHAYEVKSIAGLLLCTTKETMLDDLIERPLEAGDALSNANSIILMGKVRDGSKMGRALHVAKHRGSACDDGIHPYVITEQGLRITDR
ncbi:MAG: recombinase RecA [Planctomycetaceae bacterium]|nr:recombinase RecA [Planctomycetaceae bacterium]